MKKPRVLVVDGDPLFRSLLTSILRNDFRVVAVQDGQQALHRALEALPAVLIMEINLPGQPGLQTLKTFRDHPLLSGVRRVVITTDSSRSTVMAAINHGAQDFVLKASLNREDLLRRVHRQASLSTIERQPAPRAPAPTRAEPGHAHAGRAKPTCASRPEVAPPYHSDDQQEQLLQAIIDNWD